MSNNTQHQATFNQDAKSQQINKQQANSQDMSNQQIWGKQSRQPLIFTERRLLPKLFDTLMTLIAWGGFIWLLYLGVRSLLHAVPEARFTLLGQTFGTLSFYIIIAVLNSLLLIFWAKYNQRRFSTERRTRRQALPDTQLTQHFGLTPQVLEQLKQAQIVVVHHNDDGTTLEIEVRRQNTALAS